MRNGTLLLLMLCCGLSAQRRDEYRRDFQKTATLGAGKSFRIEHSNGNVNIRAVPGTELRIQATIRCSARSTDEARACTDRIQISVDESATGVSVRTVYPRNEGRNNISFGADYDVTMPEAAVLDLRNRFGSVSVTNVRAGATINNSNGKVTFSGGRGQQRVENSFGDVDVRGNDGNLTLVNGNGNVTIDNVTGAVDVRNRFGATRVTNAGRGLTIRSDNGNIQATNVGGVTLITNSFGRVILSDARGDVTVQNQNGAIQADGITGTANLHATFDRVNFSRIGKALVVRASNSNVTGDTVGESATVETTFGSVDVRGVKGGARVTASNSSIRLTGIGGEAYAKTSFAGITVADVAGPITVENQNGSVVADAGPGQRCQPITLRTSFGPIRVTVPSGTGYNVAARTSFGRIHSDHDLTINGQIGSDVLTGKIAGGGCDLSLSGQNSNIDILKSR